MKKIDHIAVLVDDLEISEKWYEEICGAKTIYKDHKLRRMQMDNTTIALISKYHYPYAHIAIPVEKYADLPSNLGEIVHHRDGTTGCYVLDPDGNVVEFIYYSDDCRKDMKI
jgi:catechol 2,3-dioxygenase-like lactoylglutathione lyase family enzyme